MDSLPPFLSAKLGHQSHSTETEASVQELGSDLRISLPSNRHFRLRSPARLEISAKAPSFRVCHFIVEARRQGVKRDSLPGPAGGRGAPRYSCRPPPQTNERSPRSARLNAGPRACSAPLGRGRTCLGSLPPWASSPDTQRRCGHGMGAKRSLPRRAQHPYCWWLQCERRPPPRRTLVTLRFMPAAWCPRCGRGSVKALVSGLHTSTFLLIHHAIGPKR